MIIGTSICSIPKPSPKHHQRPLYSLSSHDRYPAPHTDKSSNPKSELKTESGLRLVRAYMRQRAEVGTPTKASNRERERGRTRDGKDNLEERKADAKEKEERPDCR